MNRRKLFQIAFGSVVGILITPLLPAEPQLDLMKYSRKKLKLKNFRIYNHALSAEEIQKDFEHNETDNWIHFQFVYDPIKIDTKELERQLEFYYKHLNRYLVLNGLSSV